MPEIYRFRTIKNLFGKFEELERQSIYFAHPSQLNDPMEQIRNIIWQGDEIIWRNLFKHYLYCLDRVFCLTVIAGEEFELGMHHIPVFEVWSDTKTHQHLAMLEEIEKTLFADVDLQSLLDNILTYDRAIGRSELVYYLNVLHFTALPIIQNAYIDHGLLDETVRHALRDGPTFADLTTKELAEFTDAEDRERFFSVMANRLADLLMTEDFDNAPHLTGQSGRNRRFVMVEFPSVYVRSLGQLLNPEWYIGCFTRAWDSELMWAHYSDGHKGVCLIFGTIETDENQGLSLYQPTSYSSHKDPETGEITNSEHWDWQVDYFVDVEYANRRGTVDFFTQIASLPRKKALDGWYREPDGSESICAAHLANSETVEEWRDQLWDNLYQDVMIKTRTWNHELEARLIKYDILQTMDKANKRTLKYDFRSLKGIIFGINASEYDVKRIADIVTEKCAENPGCEVRLYRAYYANSEGRIGRRTIRTIKSPAEDDSS